MGKIQRNEERQKLEINKGMSKQKEIYDRKKEEIK